MPGNSQKHANKQMEYFGRMTTDPETWNDGRLLVLKRAIGWSRYYLAVHQGVEDQFDIFDPAVVTDKGERNQAIDDYFADDDGLTTSAHLTMQLCHLNRIGDEQDIDPDEEGPFKDAYEELDSLI